MEQLDYDLLFRWFVGLNLDDPIWDVTVFTKNRDRLLAGEIAQAFFDAVITQARERKLLPRSTSRSMAPSVSSRPRQGQELKPKAGDPARPRTIRGIPPSRTSGGAPVQRHPRLDDGPRGPALQEGAGPGGETLLPGAPPHGEPAWPGSSTQVTQATGTAEAEAALCMTTSLPGRRGDHGWG